MAYSTIDKPSKYFNTVTYAGAGGTQSVSGLSFTPDLVWIKNRSITADHMLYDVVRGTGSSKALTSDNTDAEGLGTNVGLPSQYGYLSAFNSDGFTVVAGSSNGNFVNTSGNNFVSWNWDANGAGVSNTSGTISSTVSANTTSGFSIVTYTGNATISTVGHGLGVAPKMLITKNRDQGSGGWNWKVYHASLGNTKDLTLNATTQALSPSDYGQSVSPFWNDTTPTSTVFTIGADGVINASGNKFIAYCFAEVKGFSKAFSYTGNGSTDGSYVYCGFRPAFVMIKRTDTVSEWSLFDNKRSSSSGSNLVDYVLTPNESSAEVAGSSSSSRQIDLLSNGFKFRTTSGGINASGGTYIGIAFAEQPFVSSKSIPCTAR
jgi:hypothetical protein